MGPDKRKGELRDGSRIEDGGVYPCAMPDRNNARGRTYRDGIADERPATVAELHAPDNAVGQISLLPQGDGFLIRAWSPNGTAEYGGGNLTAFSCVLRVVAGRLTVEHLSVRAAIALSERQEP